MNNAQMRALLTAIEVLALLPYPYPDDEIDRDADLILALGEIAGCPMRARNAAEAKR